MSDFNQTHIFKKSPNIKFHKNPSSGSWVVPCRQTDVMKLSHFLQFCQCTDKHFFYASTCFIDTVPTNRGCFWHWAYCLKQYHTRLVFGRCPAWILTATPTILTKVPHGVLILPSKSQENIWNCAMTPSCYILSSSLFVEHLTIWYCIVCHWHCQ